MTAFLKETRVPSPEFSRYRDTPFRYSYDSPTQLRAAIQHCRDKGLAGGFSCGGTYFFGAVQESGLNDMSSNLKARDYDSRPLVVIAPYQMLTELIDYDYLAKGGIDQTQIKNFISSLHSTIAIINIFPVKEAETRAFLIERIGEEWANRLLLSNGAGIYTLAFPSIGHPTMNRIVEAASAENIDTIFATSANEPSKPTISDPTLLHELFPNIPLAVDPRTDYTYLELAFPSKRRGLHKLAFWQKKKLCRLWLLFSY